MNQQAYNKFDGEEIHTEDLNINRQTINSQNVQSQQRDSITDESVRLKKKTAYQFRALFYKSISLQSKQIGTNLCQIFTPLICLIFVFLIKKLAENQFGTTFSLDYPFIFNLPGIYQIYPFIDNSTCLEWYAYDFEKNATDSTREFVGYNNGVDNELPNGLLKNIFQNKNKCQFEPKYKEKSVSRNVPFFKMPPENTSINEEIYESLQILNEVPYQRGIDLNSLDIIPDGAVQFQEASKDKLVYKVQINDLRIPEYHRNNGITKYRFKLDNMEQPVSELRVAEGQISLIDLISRAYLQTFNENVWLVSGIQYMPLVGEDKAFIMRIISITGASLYPLALSLLLPIFMYVIVLEKEEKLLEMMKMNGMRMKDYWLMTFLFSLTLTVLTYTLFYLFGYFILGLSFFTETSLSLLFVCFFGWGLSQIALSFFFQVFLSKARSATIIGYLLSIWTSLIAVTINAAVYPDPYQLPFTMRLYPPLGFSRLMYIFSFACSNGQCFRRWDSITDEIKDCIIFLYVGFVVFTLLGVYLHEVIPQEFGTQQHWLFCLRKLRKRNKGNEFDSSMVNQNFEGLQEDQDSKQEREFIRNIEDHSQYPLVIRDLRKVYKPVGGRPEHVAVKNLSLHVKKGEIFGLLGPNGAGKTTLISMITGVYAPTKGNAWIAGYDIVNNIEMVHLNMGVCPQFDLLWPDLTVEEHLLFYARLKGVPPSEEKAKVERAMKEVYLEQKASYKTAELSGGMKRRLSVAISLVGDPSIIFLDEPSTGLDPKNRRKLWDILSECRGKRAMVLTTHSMEEADVLCSRIGIITNGSLRCIGQSVTLKKNYGKGYHLYINCEKKKQQDKSAFDEESHQSESGTQEEIKDNLFKYIDEIIPKNEKKPSFNMNFIFQIPNDNLKVSQIFDLLEKEKARLKISDWGISQSSLEDVFMSIVETAEQ
ncbi:hypothetical protein ABPG74_014208 [Tetrahymena malaccensis]